MDDDRRELLRRLFAAATELTETVHDAATAGQSGALKADDYAEAAGRLRTAAGNVAVLANAAMVMARPGPENGPDSP